MKSGSVRHLMRRLVVIGNIIFVLWILLNGIDEGFKARPVQLASYLALVILLVLSSYLLSTEHK